MSCIQYSESKIEQVLLNISKNAFQSLSTKKYNHDETPAIGIRTRDDGDLISDNGPGMDEDTSRKIFEPFYTTKKNDTGTGLGLFISYLIIVNGHEGKISVNSIPG